MSKGAILGATTCKACARLGCQKTFPPRGRKRFCSSVCRKIADQESEAFQRRQYKRSVQQHERRIQHQRRRRVFTAAVAEDHEVVQGGVPRAAPRQFPDISPEAIERFENARRLKDKEEEQ